MQTRLYSEGLMGMHPVAFFLLALVLLWAGTLLGSSLRRRRERTFAEETATFKTLEGAVLALLGLLLGFTFAMGVSRYDQRKALEIAEANDLGTTWLRTATLPEPARSAEQALLRAYAPVRLEFLSAGTSRPRIERSLAQAGALQAQMWHIAAVQAQTMRDPVTALFLATLNESFDATERRTAAFENRIPLSAWVMLLFVSFVGSVLVGVGIGSRSQLLRLVLPIVVAAALGETLDLDSPRSGFIHVYQHSMERVAEQISAGPLP